MNPVHRNDSGVCNDAGQVTGNACGACGATLERKVKRLMTRDEVDQYLTLSSEHVEFLINTRQIATIRIKGEMRFDRQNLDQLIEGYKKTAQSPPHLRNPAHQRRFRRKTSHGADGP